MNTTARGLIEYARSIADLQNTKFISYQDEINLINEAYRDIYSQYTESDGDYYVNELVIDITPSMADPNNAGRGILVPLPTDFLKIRTLSYNFGGQWCPVQKFSMSNRDNNTSAPAYRLKNSNLWLIGGTSMYTQIKLDYYPIPEVITAPEEPIKLAENVPMYDYPTIVGGDYDRALNTFYYIRVKNIFIETLNDGNTIGVYVSPNAISGLSFKAGKLYWIDTVTKILYTANAIGLISLTPVSFKTGVENFSIQKNRIYYSTATETRSCNLGGLDDVLVLSSSTIDYCVLGNDYAYIDGTGFIVVNGIASTVSADQLVTNDVDLFYREGYKFTRCEIVDGALDVKEVINENAIIIGAVTNDYIMVVEPEIVIAQSLIADSTLDYPTNEVNEILAYTSAIAYARKQDDDKKMALLKDRLNELWERFWSVNKRDQYQFTRINNDYHNGIGNW